MKMYFSEGERAQDFEDISNPNSTIYCVALAGILLWTLVSSLVSWNSKTLAPWKTSYDQPRQHIKKQRHYFANKSPYSQSYGFSSSHVRMWELDHKEAQWLRIDVFELWCWRRLLRFPWTARRSNQEILKEINPEYSLKGLMLKLKL